MLSFLPPEIAAAGATILPRRLELYRYPTNCLPSAPRSVHRAHRRDLLEFQLPIAALSHPQIRDLRISRPSQIVARQLRQHLVRQRDRRVVRNQYRVVVDAEALWIVKKKIFHKSCVGRSEQLLPAVDVPRQVDTAEVVSEKSIKRLDVLGLDRLEHCLRLCDQCLSVRITRRRRSLRETRRAENRQAGE